MSDSNLIHNDFQLDERLKTSSFHLIDWPLCRILLKNNADYPWFILVPRRQHITDLTELTKSEQYQLLNEIDKLSRIIQEIFKPDKINIGTLGNIVTQFHMHIVARFQYDPLWPQGIWQSAPEKPYIEPEALIARLTGRLSSGI